MNLRDLFQSAPEPLGDLDLVDDPPAWRPTAPVAFRRIRAGDPEQLIAWAGGHRVLAVESVVFTGAVDKDAGR